jgi:predicted PurR-regulated permease PerM
MDPKGRKAVVWFFLTLFLGSCLMMGWLLLPFLSILVMGAVVTGVFRPIYWRLAEGRAPPAVASLVTCVVIFCILFIPIVIFVGILSNEAYEMYLMARGAVLQNQIQSLFERSELLERINRALSSLNIRLTGEEIKESIPELGKIVGLFLYEQANAVASNLLRFLVNFFFMLVVVYFLLIDGEKLTQWVIDLSPLPPDHEEKLMEKFKAMAGAILIGNGLCGLLQGLIGGITFALFGLRSAFLWGAVMAVLAFLPIIGIGVIFIPAAIYLAVSGRILAGIGLLLIYALLSGGVEYLLKPKLVGRRVQMHTLLVFLSIVGGLHLFGILGIIFGPLVVTAFLTLTDIYHASYRIQLQPRQ